MTYEKVSDYTLANKLKKQFCGRGAALNGMQASTTSELMKLAEMGKDPRVNCAEQAFRNQYTVRKNSGNTSRVNSEYSYERRGAERAYSGSQRSHEQRRESAKTTAERNTQRRRPQDNVYSGMKPITPSIEIAEPRKNISSSFVIVVFVTAVMLMALLFGISEVYKMTNEISRLENELDYLQSRAEMLEIELEEKNDIKEIEEIASEKLGMVSEDLVTRKYVSLSNGEHIDVIAQEEDETTGGIVLSSIFSSLGDLLDRFK